MDPRRHLACAAAVDRAGASLGELEVRGERSRGCCARRPRIAMKLAVAIVVSAACLVAYVSTTRSAAEPADAVSRAARAARIPSAKSFAAGCPQRRSKMIRYISPRGSDAGPGTRRRPWRTIQKGLDGVRPGQMLLVRAGIY